MNNKQAFKLSQLSDHANGGRFLVIGRAGMDFYPEPPGTAIEDAVQFSAALGGSSANICVAMQKHGVETALMTRVSDDAIGRYCVKQLQQYGVDTRHVHMQGGEYRNSLAVSESRVLDHQTVIYRNGAADFQMSVDDVSAVDYSQYCAVVTTGTVLASEPSRSATFLAFEKAQQAGCALIFDVDYRPYSWGSAEEAADVYSRAGQLCDIIIGNDVEFGFMAGDYEEGLAKARALAMQSKVAVYKRGELGAITITSEAEFNSGIYPANALKPTGAGDSFMGGIHCSTCQQLRLTSSGTARICLCFYRGVACWVRACHAHRGRT